MSVSTLEPTEVPNALATSLAPTPTANMKAIRKPAVTMNITSNNIIKEIGVVVVLKECFYAV